MKPKILFILKRRPDFDPVAHSAKGLSTGLFNSATFMEQMLNNNGVESKVDVAVDNNEIDRMVHQYKPTHVIIEALWVVPTKFNILIKLHPKVKWIIRLHSELPFISLEGNAMDWIGEYLTFPEISIGVNAPRMLDEIRFYLETKSLARSKYTIGKGYKRASLIQNRVFYLPNYYPQEYKTKEMDYTKRHIDVSCFGAIRPLKNHLSQAMAALMFAVQEKKKLRFHINLGRVEMKADPILRNLQGMFQHLEGSGHEMIGHQWVPRDEFLDICSKMDIGMQCNFSETFNIVSADLLSQGVPVLTSKEIPWADASTNADPTNTENMATLMRTIYYDSDFKVKINQRNLTNYTKETETIWLDYFIKRY